MERFIIFAACVALLFANTFLALSNPPTLPTNLDEFRPRPCNRLPFAAIAQRHPIDASCDLEGEPRSPAHAAQNRAKNNFCAQGPAIPLTLSTFAALQQMTEQRLRAASIPFGSRESLPPDRTVLTNFRFPNGMTLGEGNLVSLVAFIIDSRHSNLRGGEANNCNRGGKEFNDIHIELGAGRRNDPCTSVTAEISPHFRPESWDSLDDFDIFVPVRISGQLFFDASHSPCRPGRRARPARISSWEIHPVYSIDVCKTGTPCRMNVNSDWIPFNMWVELPENGDENSH